MKKIILLPIILGSALLITGSIIFSVAVAKNIQNSDTEFVNKTYNVSDFTNFDIDIDTAHVEFKPTTDGTSKVEISEREKEYHTVEVKDGTLTIKSFDDRKWYERIFNWYFQNMTIKVYAPEQTYNNLKISSHTGDIYIPDGFTFSDVNVKLSTGNITLKSDVTNTTSIETSTGNISLEMDTKNLTTKTSTGNQKFVGVHVSEAMNLKASTGSLTLNDVTAKSLEANTSTGDMRFTNVIVEENIKLKASTGDINFMNCDAASLDIETDTGDVILILLTGKTYDVRSSTGRPHYPDPVIGAGLCRVKTSTGLISIKIA